MALPLIILTIQIIFKLKRKIYNKNFFLILGYSFFPFKESFFFWDILTLFRKFIILLIFSICVNDIYNYNDIKTEYPMIIVFVILILFLVILIKLKPFKKEVNTLNTIETSSLTCLCFSYFLYILYLNIKFIDFFKYINIYIYAIIFIINLAFILKVIKVYFQEKKL